MVGMHGLETEVLAKLGGWDVVDASVVVGLKAT